MYSERMNGYAVTEDGRVLTYKGYQNGAELTQSINGKGYYHVNINGMTTTVHRLVAWKYCEGYTEGLTVNHIDGNKLNNHKDNLEWVSNKDNCKHAMKYISTSRRLYTNEEIKEIKELYALWKTKKDRRYTSVKLAAIYNVSKVTIMNIINGKRWSYL